MRRIFRQDDPFDFFFVRRIHHRVHKRDDERLCTLVDEAPDLLADVLFVHPEQRFALVIHAFLDTDDELRRHERFRTISAGQIGLRREVEAVAVATRTHQRHRGLITGGGQNTDPRAIALDQRIRPERRAVTHRIDGLQHLAESLPEFLARLVQCLHESRGKIVVRGQRLRFDVVTIEREKTIGKRTSDINTNSTHLRSPFSRGVVSGCRCRVRYRWSAAAPAAGIRFPSSCRNPGNRIR